MRRAPAFLSWEILACTSFRVINYRLPEWIVSCALFIRAYWKDLDWLELCLASRTRYCSGFHDVVVTIPRGSEPWLRRACLPRVARIEFCRDYRDDYLGQQSTKLHADTFTDADFICHVDADCIFVRPAS